MSDSTKPTTLLDETSIEELLTIQGFPEHDPIQRNGIYRLPTVSERNCSVCQTSSYLMARSFNEALRYYWEGW